MCIRVATRNYQELSFTVAKCVFTPYSASCWNDTCLHMLLYTWTRQYAVCIVQYAVCIVQYAVCSQVCCMQYAVCIVQYAVCIVQYAVCSQVCCMQYAVCIVQYAVCSQVCSMLYAVCSMHRTVCSMQLQEGKAWEFWSCAWCQVDIVMGGLGATLLLSCLPEVVRQLGGDRALHRLDCECVILHICCW